MEPQEKETQMRSQMKYLENIIGTIEGQIGRLADRLHSVLSTPVPNTAEAERIEDNLVPLAQEIAECRKRLIIISRGLEEIDERLEL